jgi:hypothetical protein
MMRMRGPSYSIFLSVQLSQKIQREELASLSWKPVKGFNTIVQIDDVDISLLAIAREELAVVANQ